MNLLQILLRLLLCIGLVLNGSAYAMAGGSMQDSVMAATDHGMAMTDCHDAETAPEPADLPQPAHAGHDGASDCCQAGDSCHCDCQQHSPVTMQQAVMLGAQTVDTPVVPNADAGRAAPPPQRLIRPPIAA